MKHIWNRITLERYRLPDDDEKTPWYAWPLVALFIYGWLNIDHLPALLGF